MLYNALTVDKDSQDQEDMEKQQALDEKFNEMEIGESKNYIQKNIDYIQLAANERKKLQKMAEGEDYVNESHQHDIFDEQEQFFKDLDNLKVTIESHKNYT